VTVDVEIENRTRWRVDEPAVERAVRATLAAEGVDEGELGVIFVDEDQMAELNDTYRGKHGATDVLSFPLDAREEVPKGLPRQLGDVVVCPALAASEGTPIATLLVHGVLHLVGWDHEHDEGEMLERQELLTQKVEDVDADPA
jgi:probable rRNA maturation factor